MKKTLIVPNVCSSFCTEEEHFEVNLSTLVITMKAADLA